MDLMSLWVLWIALSVGLVLAVRIALFAMLKKLLVPRSALAWTYAGLASLFFLGLVVVGLSGMPMYGFDEHNWRHWLGYVVLFFSPLGLPLILGMPFILLFDIVRRSWRDQPHEAKSGR